MTDKQLVRHLRARLTRAEMQHEKLESTLSDVHDDRLRQRLMCKLADSDNLMHLLQALMDELLSSGAMQYKP